MRTQHEKYLIQHGWAELSYAAARWRDPANGQILKTSEAVDEQRKRIEYEAQQGAATDQLQPSQSQQSESTLGL